MNLQADKFVVDGTHLRFSFTPTIENIVIQSIEELIDNLHADSITWNVEDKSDSFQFARNYKKKSDVIMKLRQIQQKDSKKKSGISSLQSYYRDSNGNVFVLIPA